MDDFRKYASDYRRNWDGYRGPLSRKLALAARNRLKATVSGGCCGNHGEPGC